MVGAPQGRRLSNPASASLNRARASLDHDGRHALRCNHRPLRGASCRSVRPRHRRTRELHHRAERRAAVTVWRRPLTRRTRNGTTAAARRASPVAPALQAGPQVGRVEAEELADGDEAERRSIVIGCKPFGNVPEETPIPTAPATLVNLPAAHRVLQHGPQQAVLRRERAVAADQGGVLNRKQEFVLDRRIEPGSGGVHARVEKQERCPRPSPPSRRASVRGADRASHRVGWCRSAGTLATPSERRCR